MELATLYLLDGKGVNNRTSRQEALKSARFDTKSDTKLGRGLIVADQAPFLSDGRLKTGVPDHIPEREASALSRQSSD